MSRAVVVGPGSILTPGFGAFAHRQSGLLTGSIRKGSVGPPYPVVDVGFGRAVAGQTDVIVWPANWRPNPTIPIVMLCHGTNGKAHSWLVSGAADKTQAILANGMPVVSGDQEGPPANVGASQANDASQANTMTLLAWAQDRIGCRSDKALIVGTSLGSWLAMNLHKNHPTTFLASAHALTATSSQAVYNASAGGADGGVFKANTDQAYSDFPGGWAAAAATHDPASFYPDLTGLPMWMGNTTDDPTNGGQSGVDSLAAAIGGTAVDGPHYYGTGGHDISKIPGADVAAFLYAHSGM